MLPCSLPPGWTTPEGATNWLGTDHLGRDSLSRLIFGARISLDGQVATIEGVVR